LAVHFAKRNTKFGGGKTRVGKNSFLPTPFLFTRPSVQFGARSALSVSLKIGSDFVKIARDSNIQEKKVAAKEIFDSNLRLTSRAVRGEPVFPYTATQRAAALVGQKDESLILVPRAGFGYK
jgi:hypothetical protein